MSLSKLYCTVDCYTNEGMLKMATNDVQCKECMKVFHSKRAFANHTLNNGCIGKTPIRCFCGELLQNHIDCLYLMPVHCGYCAITFKTMEKAIEHCQKVHNDGTWYDYSSFIYLSDLSNARKDIVAQCNKCSHHWNFGQMEKWWNTGDNSAKRHLVRKVLKSGFHDCSILELMSIRGKLIGWEKKPRSENLRIFNVNFPDGMLQVHLDVNQKDFIDIYKHIENLIDDHQKHWWQFKPAKGLAAKERARLANNVMRECFPNWKSFCEPEAQGFFDFKITHELNFQPILDQITGLAQSTFTGENLKRVLSLLSKIGICYASNWNLNIISLVLFDFLMTCDIPVHSAQDAIKLVVASIPVLLGALKVKAQSEDVLLDKEFVTPIATIMSIIVGALFLKSVPKMSEVDDFVSGAIKLGNLMRGLDNSWKGLSKIVNCVYDYAYEYFIGYPKNISDAGKYIEGVEEWFKNVNALCSNDVIEKLQVDGPLCRQIERLYLQGLTISTKSAHLKLSPEMRRAIEGCQRNISSLNDKVSKSGAFCSGPKVEPLIIQLWGASGVGKSGMMYLLSGDILKTEDLLSGGDGTACVNWANQIYPRNVEQEFFDGYRNQLIVLYDDFGQLRDSQAKPNIEFMEMIRFGNLAPMCLHMAALEQKDKTYFSSKCVVLSSNCREYQIESLISKEAFNRRIDLSIEVRVCEKWRIEGTEKLDTEKVVENFKSPLVPDVYECRLWKDGVPCPIWISYNSLRDIITRTYASKMNRHYELTAVLSEYMKVPLVCDPWMIELKREIEHKMKLKKLEHYTLNEFMAEAQSIDLIEDDYFDAIEENCVPNFPKHMRNIALRNRKNWSTNSKKVKVIDDVIYMTLISGELTNDIHCRFENFADALEDALEVVHGDWRIILDFISKHLSFFTLKTQFVFSSGCYREVLSNPETAIDFFRSGNFVCENKDCWHPDISSDSFGFQEGCQKQFINFALMQGNHHYGFVYDSFVTFELVEQSKISRIQEKLMKKINTFSAHAKDWLSNVSKWIGENPEVLIFGTYCTMALGLFGFVLFQVHKQLESERDEALMEAINEFQTARNMYLAAREKLYRIESQYSNEVLTHKHEGLAKGLIVKHAHECESCGVTFFHKHEIKDPEISEKFYKHLCKDCKNKAEFQSGDSVTTHKAVVKTELQSGDSVTTHKAIVKTELQSGDSVTTHKSVVTTQGDVFKQFVSEVMTESSVQNEEFLQEFVSKQIHDNNAISAELAADPNAMVLSRKVFANTYMISTRKNEGENWTQHVNCVFIRGRTALTVGHLAPVLSARSSGQIKIDGPFKPEGYILPIDSLRYKTLKYADGSTKDMMLLFFPSNVHDHQDISSSLADSETMSKFKSAPSMLITPTLIKDKAIFNQRFADAKAMENELTYRHDGSEGGRIKIRQHYTYVMQTTNGDCGSFLVLLSNYLPKKIIGMHVAGDGYGRGYSVPINVRDIEEALKDVPLEAQIKMDLSMYEADNGELSSTPEGDFTPAIKSSLKIATPSNTALRKSPIYGKVLTPITAPAPLSRRVILEDGTIHDPVLAGLKKTGKIPPYIDPDLIEAACNDVLRLHQTNNRVRKRVLTNMEALTGVEDDIYSNPLNRSSSAGYPWIKDRIGKGKMKWTSDPEGEYKMHIELEKAILDREEMALQNQRYPTIWIDTLKDERRPLEKVKVGKTRVFSAGPMDFVVAFRKYFLGFCAHVADHRIDNEIAVGINPYSYDWTHLAKHLKKKGTKVVAGDFGNFDGTLLLQILVEIGKLINEWYDDGETNRQIRDIMWKELVNSVHIEGDNIYLWTHGHPSGHPLTAILNSLYNSVVCRIVFILCAKRIGKIVTMKDFTDNVSMISYGDDNVLNISDEVFEWFNQNTMSEVFATIGMEYTDELKSSAANAKPYRTLDEVSFLKRKFRWDDERVCYTAPLEYGVCMEMVNWIRGELDIEEACATNCQTSAMELSLHGREVFNTSVALIKKACLETMQNQPQILTYHEYILKFEESYGMMMENPNLELGV